jgi:N-acetylmuramoyl-L-alanine amidase
VFTNGGAQHPQSQESRLSPEAVSGKEYRVQFLTSSRKYENGASVFKGLTPVDYYTDGKTYKYTYGRTTNQKKAGNY